MSDYTQSVIYMIVCNDEAIQEGYVGSTSKLERRKITHKSGCNNLNHTQYNKPLYQFIRANGGWKNWQFKILEHYPCQSKKELHLQELYWINQFDNLLNKQKPFRTRKQHYQDNKKQIDKINKQYRQNNKDTLQQKAKEKYNCECGGKYTYSSKARHLKSIKHLTYLEKDK